MIVMIMIMKILIISLLISNLVSCMMKRENFRKEKILAYY